MSSWSTGDVREMVWFTQSHLFSLGSGRGHGTVERAEVDALFDEWLAGQVAEARGRALEDAADDVVLGGRVSEAELPSGSGRREVAAWLRRRARGERRRAGRRGEGAG